MYLVFLFLFMFVSMSILGGYASPVSVLITRTYSLHLTLDRLIIYSTYPKLSQLFTYCFLLWSVCKCVLSDFGGFVLNALLARDCFT
jgi:hypothetical protein